MYAFRQLISWSVDRFHRFTLIDIAACKLCLLSIGTLFGVYCTKFFRRFAPILWVVAAVSWIYLIWRLVLCDD